MNKKVLTIGLIVFIVSLLGAAGYVTYRFVNSGPSTILPLIAAIPDNAVYIVETDDPVASWQQVTNTDMWQQLSQHPYLADFTQDINDFNKLIQQNEMLSHMIGSRSVMISSHPLRKDVYEFIFVVDVRDLSVFSNAKTLAGSALGDDYEVSFRTYQENEIVELYNKVEKYTILMS